MIDLVLTHLNQPWGPPGTLETLGDPWRPLATMPQNGQNGQNDHFQAWSPRVAKGFQGPRGTPGMGEMSYNQIDHI